MSATPPARTGSRTPAPPVRQQRQPATPEQPPSALAYRQPPVSLDSEQAVLGAAMISREAVDVLLADLLAEDFHLQAHQWIYEVIEELSRKGVPIDVLTVPEELRRRGQLDKIGGIAYINTLAESVPTAAHQAWYGAMVFEKWRYRGLIESAESIKQAAHDQQQSPDEIIAQAEADFRSQERATADASEIAIGAVMLAREVSMQSGEAPDYLPLGIRRVDELVKLMEGDLVIVAGRPSMGKTAIALKMAYQWVTQGISVAFFTLESSPEKMADRMIAAASDLPLKEIQGRRLTEDERRRHTETTEFLAMWPLVFVARSSMTVAGIRAKSLRLKREKGLKVVIIDQLSFIDATGKHDGNNSRYEQIVRDLGRLAKDLKLRVILLHQLSRAVETRPNKRPMLSDLRDSGSIEQDARVVLLLYRESYYQYLQRGQDEPDLGVLEIIQAKGSEIGTGMVRLQYDRSTQWIGEPEGRYAEDDIPPPHLTPDPQLVQQAMDMDDPFDEPAPPREEWTDRI